MADILVAYYSRTGTTRKIAKYLGELWAADVEEIKPIENFHGFFGALRGIWMVLWRKQPLIIVGMKGRQYERTVLIVPIWADHIAPPAETWLSRRLNDGANVDVVTVSASNDADEAIRTVSKGNDGRIKHILHVRRSALESDGTEKILSALQ